VRAICSGWTLALAGFVVFGLLAWQVHGDGGTVWDFDREVAQALKEHADAHPRLVGLARDATDAGSVPVMTALALVGSLLLWLCGHSRLAACWLLAAALGSAIDLTCKSFFERPRPDAALRDDAVTERNPSFPSGHSMGSTIGYGSLGYAGAVLLRKRWAKVILALGLLLLVLAIGASRIYLRAHWCSDVAAGFAIGVCWLAVCVSLLRRR
jgi:undecaprenyl-diphosphatase